MKFKHILNEKVDFEAFVRDGRLIEPTLSTEQRELYLYVTNDVQIYRQRIEPIEKNLSKKIAKEQYNSLLAIKAWQYVADDGSKKYNKEFGYGFTKEDRDQVAIMLAYEFEQDNL